VSTRPRTLATTLLLASIVAQAAPASIMAGQGGCPAKKPVGSIRRIAAGPIGGTAAAALVALPDLANTQAAAAAGEAPWLRTLSGSAGPNREYQERGHQVLVLTACDTTACDASRAYVAFDRSTGEWGATVVEGRQLRDVFGTGQTTTLAMHPAFVGAALLCAMTVDRPAAAH